MDCIAGSYFADGYWLIRSPSESGSMLGLYGWRWWLALNQYAATQANQHAKTAINEHASTEADSQTSKTYQYAAANQHTNIHDDPNASAYFGCANS